MKRSRWRRATRTNLQIAPKTTARELGEARAPGKRAIPNRVFTNTAGVAPSHEQLVGRSAREAELKERGAEAWLPGDLCASQVVATC